MNAKADAALRSMKECIGSAGAEHYARLALERGVRHDEIQAAWREWRELRASETQTIHSDPRPDTLCACADTAFWHEGNTGRCVVPGCGCRWIRPGGKRWTA